MADFIPVNEPLIGTAERDYLNACLDTGWVSSEGEFVGRFEAAVAAQAGRRHGIAVSSGSAALDVAVAALGFGPGDEVIMPTFTIISCAAAVVRSGARPVLVDCEPDTWNMDTGQLEARITERTRAIMPVHIYGLPVDMDPVLELARRHDLRVIEDAAEAIGQTYRDQPCGGFGDISVLSFYANKHVTSGEGGMLLTDSDALAERCRELKNLCFQSGRRFIHEELGWNYRMTNLQAALGLGQLERLAEHTRIKRHLGASYDSELAGIEGLQIPVAQTAYARNVYWVYGVVPEGEAHSDARRVMKMLAQKGIGTRPFFWPMHEQPVLRRMDLFENQRFPVAERLARRGFYLPSGLNLTNEQICRVAETVRAVLA